MITPSKSHKKRAVLDFIGNMAGDIFGIMDARSKKQHMEDIGGLMENDRHLMNLLKNQTSVVEKTLNILRVNGDELKRQNEQFMNLTKRIDKTMDEYAAASFFSDIVAHMIQEISDFDSQMDNLLETIFDGRKHHVNHNLFPPNQLALELKTISEHVRNKYLIPEGNHVYNLLSVKPHISTNQILFHISIPLFRLDVFKIFEIISVPFTGKNRTWSIHTEHEYLIVANDRTHYQFMKHSDLQRCTNFDEYWVCWGPYQWIMARVQSCEWNIFNEVSNENCTMVPSEGTSIWHNVGENQWLFYSKVGSDLTLICHDGVFRERIIGSGLLQFDSNCTIRNFDMEIHGKKSFHGRRINILVPKINKYHEHSIEWERTTLNSNWSSANVDELQKQIEVIKANSQLPFELRAHDIHHYTTSYALVAVLVVCAVFGFFKYDKLKKHVEQLASIPLTRAISMPTIDPVVSNEGAESAQ